MTWRTIGLAALVGGFLVYFLSPPIKKPIICRYPTPRIESEEVAAHIRKMAELQERTQKLVESLNQEVDVERSKIGEHHIADPKPIEIRWTSDCFDTLPRSKADSFASFVQLMGFEKGAAAYQLKVTEENRARILRPENLIDAEQREASRRSIRRLQNYLMDYWQFVLSSLEQAEASMFDYQGNSLRGGSYNWRIRQAFDQTRKFHNLQFLLGLEELDEMERIVDLVERAVDVKVQDKRLVFQTQREQEDYARLISRLARLEALRTERQKNLQALESKGNAPGVRLLSTAPGRWDFLIYSGGRVEVDDERITIEGKSFNLPVEMTKLVALYGLKHREFAGEVTEFVWDDLGFAAVCEPGTRTVNKLIIALRAREDRPWPQKVVRGRLAVLGVTVDEKNATPWSFNRESQRHFAAADDAGRDWVLNLKRCKVRMDIKLDGSIDSIVVEAR